MVNRDPDALDLLWLALAVANSTFAETFYDLRFHNKLYSGRRRFMTQYVEKFPIPSPLRCKSKEIVSTTKEVFRLTCDSKKSTSIQEKLDSMVWEVFLGEKPPVC